MFGKENELKEDEFGNKKLPLNNFLAYLIQSFDIKKHLLFIIKQHPSYVKDLTSR
jgi:hypothetical protein